MGAKEDLMNKAKELKKQVETEKKEKIVNNLATINNNEEMKKMFAENANLGSEHLSGQSPTLKVHSTGKSTKNFLSDGVTEPNDGWFFYAPTAEQFKEVECHILTISRGYRAEGMPDPKTGVAKKVYNTLMAGVIVNDGKPRPFIMYMTGVKLSRMWEFGKEAGKYTHAKPLPVPMFALRVKLTTEKIKTSFAPSWVVNFEIMKDEDKGPIVVANMGTFNYLRVQMAKAKETIESIIEAKATDEEPGEPLNGEVLPSQEQEVLPETVNPDDIPF